jgi:transcriptional regulator with PAS, ATPase and Fis domain
MGPQRYYAKEKKRQFKKKSDWAADLALTLEQAIEDKKLKEKKPAELDAEMGFVVGDTPLMKKVVEDIRSSAGNAMTVLIEGETGTGKELVANAIHRLSGRKGFTAVNCSAVHLETLEARLFGHEKGAFTGADGMKMGLFELTTGGTVFLDEIQIMPASLQSKLIRVVQDNMIVRMGGKSEFPVDVRLIVATNKPAKELVHEGLLREDLYYRLNTLFITLPPLRQRMEDIPLLWSALIEKANKAAGKTVMTTLRKEVRELLERHAWPGNIRELEGVISRAVVNTKGSFIAPWDIVFESEQTCFETEPAAAATSIVAPAQFPSEVEARFRSQETSENMERLKQLPVDQRYEYFLENTAGDSRKSVFIEIAHMLKAGHPHKRVTSKEITEFLCGEEGSSKEEKEKFKDYDNKIRSRLSDLHLRLKELNFNQ